MLDELLGRTELKERIEELEAEAHNLERRVTAESERRADAVSARQSAEATVNRLEDRIEELEDRVARAEQSEETLAFRGRQTVRGERLTQILDRLRSVRTGPEGALTAMVTDDAPSPVRDAFGDLTPLVERAAPCLAVTDDAGLVRATLAPPLPPDPFASWTDGFRLDEAWFRPVGTLTFGVVRSDLFALGVYEDGDRTSLETVETDVMNRHSKGGFSQSRFERRREEQVATHRERVRDVIASYDPDRLVLVGEQTVLDDLSDLTPHTAAVDATGNPEAALDDAFRSFFRTTLSLL